MDDHQIDRALTAALRRAKGSAAADVDVRDCVDAERLAAWSSGALGGDEAAAVEQHLSSCDRCREVAAAFAETAVAAPGAVSAPAQPTRTFRPWMTPLAAAAAVVIWVAWPRPTPPAAPVAPADTVARARTDEPPVAAAPPPKISPAPGPTAAPSTQGGAAASPRRELARDQNARRPGTPALPDKLLAEQQLRAQEPPKTEPTFRAAQPAASTVSPPPPPAPAPALPPPATPPPVGTGPVPVAAPSPVITAPPVTAPPSPPLTQTTAAPAGRADTSRSLATEILNTRAVIAEFTTVQSQLAEAVAVAGAGRGGAGGRGGGGGGGAIANRQAIDAKAAPSAPRWRVLASGAVERSNDGGATWTPVLIDPPAQVTTGASPSPTICWLAGRGGVVLRSTANQPFVRVTPPTGTDIASIRATSAVDATVTTTDGRSFRTTDGGATWTPA